MDKVNRVEYLRSIKKDLTLLYKLGYLQSQIFRDIELLNDYFEILETGLEKMQIYNILATKYKIGSLQVRLLIKKLTINT